MKKKHILLIDDNKIDNYLSSYIISKNQLAEKTTIETSAVKALELLKVLNDSEFPDLIMLDLKMPAMDGFEFLDDLINFPVNKTESCIVVMVTSSNNQIDINRSKEYPIIKKFINKPITLQAFNEIINI
ncbi:response regulator [uncultured Flavobacterium sp.]|uniref:response regulator n=1 Tax=uncultured Flavobacterium sp. TaxID=165435 RepID=UPI0030EB877B|tara:strand:- start:179205 stop:179591 length:387 start_codon:yes stop_codon:yes gene_type:complete